MKATWICVAVMPISLAVAADAPGDEAAADDDADVEDGADDGDDDEQPAATMSPTASSTIATTRLPALERRFLFRAIT
jgi:hypothetical protein